MALNTGIALIDDISGFGIKDLLAFQAAKNQAKIDVGMADTSNYVARLNAQAALLTGQAKAAQTTGGTASAFTNNTWLMIGAAVVVVGVVLMVKK